MALNVLILMETSQVLQQAFAKLGCNAWSCDLKPGKQDPARHIIGDAFEVAREFAGQWNRAPQPSLVILHPVCRFLSVSGQHWIGKPGHEDRAARRDSAVQDFMRCIEVASQFTAGVIENPVGIMSTRYRRPDSICQPYHHGDDASKTTHLWRFGTLTGDAGFVPFNPANFVPPRMVCNGCSRTSPWEIDFGMFPAPKPQPCPVCHGRLLPRWANQTDSGQNRLGPTADPEDHRAARVQTYPSMAAAWARAWVAALAESAAAEPDRK